MADQLTINYDYKKLKADYKNYINHQDFYSAMLTFNRMKEYRDPEIHLLQASMLEKLEEIGSEIDNLLTVFTNENYLSYHETMVAYRIALFYFVYGGFDRFDEYLEILKSRHPHNESIVKFNVEKLTPTNNIHFCTISGFEEFHEAIKKGSHGEFKSSIEELMKVDKSYSDYARVRGLISSFYLKNKEPEKAIQVLEDLAKDGYIDELWIHGVYNIAEVEPSMKEKVHELLDTYSSKVFKYETILVKSLIEMNCENYDTVIKLLKSLKPPHCYKSDILKFFILCYEGLGDKENLIKQIKVLYAFNPRNVWLRFCLEKLLNNEEVDVGRCVRSQPNSQMKAELKKQIKSIIKTKPDFKTLPIEEVEFLIYAIEEVKNYSIYKKVLQNLLNAQRFGVVQDVLLSVYTRCEFAQLAVQVIIENQDPNFWWVMVEGKPIKLKFSLPNCLVKNCKNQDKRDFLISVYAQTVSLILFTGGNVINIENRINEPMLLLLENSIEENELLIDSDNLVYILSKLMDEKNQEIEQSFDKIDQEIKSKLLKILHKDETGYKLRY